MALYRMYVDETGNADLGASDDPNHRFLSLTGIIISHDITRRFAGPELDRIKREVFDDLDPDTPIILHRKEIMQKKYPFTALKRAEKEEQFNSEVLNFLQRLPFIAITVVIDKKEFLQRYTVWRQDPYHYCMEILVERYVQWLDRRNFKGDIVAEARGSNENKRLCSAVRHFYDRGTGYVGQDMVQARLTSKHLKIKHKQENVTGLQVSDLIAHPSCIYARRAFLDEPGAENFGSKIADLLVRLKYHRGHVGQIKGYGLKWLP
jgi:hypothetical protein